MQYEYEYDDYLSIRHQVLVLIDYEYCTYTINAVPGTRDVPHHQPLDSGLTYSIHSWLLWLFVLH